MYALTVAAKSSNVDRQKNAQEMLAVMAEMHPKLVEEVIFSANFVDICSQKEFCAPILWH